MNLRRATMDDALDVLTWRNDAHAVAMSKSGRVVDLDSHLAWFPKALADSQCMMLIAEHEGLRIGMVRFDRGSAGWLVSINLAPAERRKGYGTSVLRGAIDLMDMRPLLAEIRADNAASIRIFECCGFHQIDAMDGWLHYRL